MFGDIIRSFRVNNGLSQTNFVDAVQRSNDSFNNLDVVTLSRWERGVTTPHLTRQHELLDLIGVNIFDVWEPNEKNLDNIKNKLNNNGYIDMNEFVITEMITVNSSNLHLLSNVNNIIDVIFECEDNFIFSEMEMLDLSRQSIIEKIIHQYGGELTLVTVNGQLVGHLLSSSLSIIGGLLSEHSIDMKDDGHLVVSFNCTHYSAFLKTMGREAYKYTQSLNPNKKLYLLLTTKRMFDLFFSLGFEYRSIVSCEITMKLMYLDSSKMKSQRTWMNIISNFKGKHDE